MNEMLSNRIAILRQSKECNMDLIKELLRAPITPPPIPTGAAPASLPCRVWGCFGTLLVIYF